MAPKHVKGVNRNGSKEMGRIGLLCHGSNLHRFGIGSNGLGSTLKNAKFKVDNILISTQFDLSQFDLSYSTKRVDLILFDLFHSTHFMQSMLKVKDLSEIVRQKSRKRRPRRTSTGDDCIDFYSICRTRYCAHPWEIDIALVAETTFPDACLKIPAVSCVVTSATAGKPRSIFIKGLKLLIFYCFSLQ